MYINKYFMYIIVQSVRVLQYKILPVRANYPRYAV